MPDSTENCKLTSKVLTLLLLFRHAIILSDLQLRPPARSSLLPSLQSRMFRDYWPRDREEGCAARLARKLRLATNMEERKVTSHKVVRYSCCLIQDIDLSVQHVLGFLVCVGGDVARGAGLDAVEAGGEVCGGVGGLSANAGWKVRSKMAWRK
jgi:hypothetical protein